MGTIKKLDNFNSGVLLQAFLYILWWLISKNDKRWHYPKRDDLHAYFFTNLLNIFRWYPIFGGAEVSIILLALFGRVPTTLNVRKCNTF